MAIPFNIVQRLRMQRHHYMKPEVFSKVKKLTLVKHGSLCLQSQNQDFHEHGATLGYIVNTRLDMVK